MRQNTFWIRIVCDRLAAIAASPAAAVGVGLALFACVLLSSSPSRGLIVSLGPHAMTALIVAWTVGAVMLLRASRLPTLRFYAFLLACLFVVESINFGLRNRTLSMLVLVQLALAVELVALALLRRLPRICSSAVSTVWHFALIVPLLAVACYNLRFNVPISQQTVVAVLQTTAFEAHEFILSYADVRVVALIAVVLVLIIAHNVAQHRAGRADVRGGACAAIAIVALAQFACAYKPLNLDKTIVGTRSRYNAELATLRVMQAARKMAMAPVVAHKQGKGELYVLVIGEAQVKDHLSAYGYSRPTTPWLDAQMTQPNWLRFDRAYSNAVQTVPALTLALTAANQYNRKSYYESVSVLDVAAAAGFRTYWLSNQRGLGRNDNAVSAIATTADVYENLGDVQALQGVESSRYDIQLVERFQALKGKIDPGGNNLIVFHLLGSHQSYCGRFPLAFARLEPQRPVSTESDRAGDRLRVGTIPAKVADCYDNSVAFTDYVLSRIHAEAKRWSGFQGLVYVPDHGEAVGIGHDPQLFSFPMVRIPLLVWLSDQYMAREPQRAMALREHTSMVWTNDLLYELLVGFMGIRVDSYDARFDLSSSSYRLDPEEALTLHGQRRVVEDPAFASPAFLRAAAR